ncbi:hypothetical protein LOD99_6402 [Oopsacas minuta]|uniref:Uncharacterized protein n=1 Tax=Oopsacas minuta TaxID=111878 RepID=A0AAV7JMA3_9METZ|nr:hypothetical protein LOD99_6402 [Oopsacas minuta]
MFFQLPVSPSYTHFPAAGGLPPRLSKFFDELLPNICNLSISEGESPAATAASLLPTNSPLRTNSQTTSCNKHEAEQLLPTSSRSSSKSKSVDEEPIDISIQIQAPTCSTLPNTNTKTKTSTRGNPQHLSNLPETCALYTILNTDETQTNKLCSSSQRKTPVAAKLKKIPNLQPIVPTKYPCAKCLTKATILTTTDKRYTDKLTVAPRFKSLAEYTKTLPLALRKQFLDTFQAITQGYPNHQEIKGCPLATHPEKRSNFYKVAPNKAPASQQTNIYPQLVTACKAINMCAKCPPEGSSPFLFREGGLGALPSSLLLDLFTHHTCNICKDEDTPSSKSLLHHSSNQSCRTAHASIHVSSPKPIPSSWDYKAPPIFIYSTGNLETARTLQQLLEFGLTFQTPQEDRPNPFLTSFRGILNLETNTPPLTYYQISRPEQRTYNRYSHLLQQLKENVKRENVQILSADKGPGLVIVKTFTVMRLYQLYLGKAATNVPPTTYMSAISRLKNALYKLNPDTQLQNTDDRVPTMYFKIKTHKATFLTHTTQHPEIYTYSNGAKELVEISRPIINHKNTITSCASKAIRNLITPIIQLHPYLTQDIFETISELSKLGPPEKIYTADVEAFYPNTPHELA